MVVVLLPLVMTVAAVVTVRGETAATLPGSSLPLWLKSSPVSRMPLRLTSSFGHVVIPGGAVVYGAPRGWPVCAHAELKRTHPPLPYCCDCTSSVMLTPFTALPAASWACTTNGRMNCVLLEFSLMFSPVPSDRNTV